MGALVPLGAHHVQGSLLVLFTLLTSPQVVSWLSGAGLAPSICQLTNVFIVTSVWTQGPGRHCVRCQGSA